MTLIMRRFILAQVIEGLAAIACLVQATVCGCEGESRQRTLTAPGAALSKNEGYPAPLTGALYSLTGGSLMSVRLHQMPKGMPERLHRPVH